MQERRDLVDADRGRDEVGVDLDVVARDRVVSHVADRTAVDPLHRVQPLERLQEELEDRDALGEVALLGDELVHRLRRPQGRHQTALLGVLEDD